MGRESSIIHSLTHSTNILLNTCYVSGIGDVILTKQNPNLMDDDNNNKIEVQYIGVE